MLPALASLVITVMGCVDGIPSPPDARRPADAGRAPADANLPRDDGGPAVDGGGPDASRASCEPDLDSLEPNDTPGTAPTWEPSHVSDSPGWVNGSWYLQACLGSANQDWYRVAASQLRFDLDVNFSGTASMRLRAIIAGTGVCAGNPYCGDELLPALPENTLTVNVYRASTMELVRTATDERGVVQMDGSSEAFTDDLLIGVSGPPEAIFRYTLSIFIDVEGSEDECEC